LKTGLLPDETIFSLMARMKILTINRRVDKLYDAILSCNYTQFCGVASYRIEFLSSQLEISLDELLNKHTSFGYYTHLMGKRHRLLFKNALKGDVSKALESLAGTVNSRISMPQYHAFCPYCAQQDIELHGVPYWHQCHELPGVTACHIHGIKLIRTPMRPKHLELPDINNSIKECANEQEILFAKLSADLRKKPAHRKSPEKVIERYRKQLDRSDYITPGGMIRSSQLLADIKYFWSDLLKIPDFQNLRLNGRTHNFVRDVLRGASTRTHPVKHLLLAGFLNSLNSRQKRKSIEEAVRDSSRPGDINFALELLRKGVSLSKSAKQSGVSYYSIRKLAHEYQIPINSKPGKLTEQQKSEVFDLLRQGMPMKKIGEAMGVSESGIDNILSAHPALRAKRKKIKQEDKEKKRVLNRQSALKIIQKNSNLTRKAIMEIDPDLFIWLKNHDKHWLYKQLPPAKSPQEAQSFRYKKQNNLWLKKQMIAIGRLKKFALKSLRRPPENTRISIAYILKSLQIRNTQSHIRRQMPMFWHQVRRLAETHEAFQLRKLEALYKNAPALLTIYSARRVLKIARSYPPVSARVLNTVEALQAGRTWKSREQLLSRWLLLRQTNPNNTIRFVFSPITIVSQSCTIPNRKCRTAPQSTLTTVI